MTGACIAMMSAVVSSIALSASLSKTATPSGGYVTSSTVTVHVPIGSSGQITFQNFVVTGFVSALQYSKNGAAFALLTDGTALTFANGDTLALRAGGAGGGAMGAGESYQFDLLDQTKLLPVSGSPFLLAGI
ncbi:MAG: hypothetical protein ABL932_20845 [Terricaulis sp.]